MSDTRVYYTVSKAFIGSAFLHDNLASNLAKDFCCLGEKISLTDIDYSPWKGNAIKRMAEIHRINSPIKGKHFSWFLHVPTRLVQNPLLYLLQLGKPEEAPFACPFSERLCADEHVRRLKRSKAWYEEPYVCPPAWQREILLDVSSSKTFELLAWSYQSIASTLRITGVSFKLLVLLSKEAGLNTARILTVSALHWAWIQLRQCQTLIDVNLHSHFRWWMLTEKNLILFSVLLTFFIKRTGR